MEYIKGLVSIITPAYNAEKFIAQSIDSVIAQTYTDWEMIIVNDCSKDNTINIVNQYDDKRIKLINLTENKGAANAWNVAFQKVKGEYIAFLDSDDVWLETKLEEQIKFMRDNHYVFTFTSYDWIDENSKSLNKVIKISKMKDFSRTMKNTNIGLLTVMLDRKEIGDISVKPIKLNWDYYLWGIILRRGYKAYGYNKVLAHYRIVSNSASRNKYKHAKAVWRLYYHELKIPLFKSMYYFLCYLLNSVKRYYTNL